MSRSNNQKPDSAANRYSWNCPIHFADGGHFREEYQTEEGEAKRDDENYFYVACWEYQGSDEKEPVLLKEPLVYEAIKVQTRNYKS